CSVVKHLWGALVGLAVLAAGTKIGAADPDPGDAAREQGEQLAKAGRFSEAIAAFKDSNAKKQRATNFCLIGLAYTRIERWPQAEIMIDRCKRNASSADPTPAWLPALEQELAKRLATVGVAPVAIVVEPATAKAQVTVSSFAPDEAFEPRTIHLPTGSHVITVTAPGFERVQTTVDVTTTELKTVTITLKPPGSAKPTDVVPILPHPTPVAASPSVVPAVLMGAGGTLIAAGIVYHVTAFRTAAVNLADATDSTPDPHLYDQWSHRFDVRRDWLIGIYAAGVITTGIGAYLHFTAKHTEALPQVSIVPLDGGGMVSVGWR
ncbi:MAG TPA: PEGA domain-containing protein, partial [Kofleriaceae bacterium]|nr:PEGA domain-containing protein [Kofleriaceae bacterium]